MQEAVLRFIVQKCISHINDKEVREAFLLLDENNDGVISLEDM